MCVWQEVGLALRTLLATVDETIPVLPASTHREVNTHTQMNHNFGKVKEIQVKNVLFLQNDHLLICLCVVTDWNGTEIVELWSGRVNFKDEVGPAVRHDQVGICTYKPTSASLTVSLILLRHIWTNLAILTGRRRSHGVTIPDRWPQVYTSTCTIIKITLL